MEEKKQQVIAIIPARGGSRRIPGKNKRLFLGRPIIEYSIDIAKRSELFDRIIVSSDDEEILDIAVKAGGVWAWWREPGFERDEVGTQEVAMSVLRSPRVLGDHPESAVACVIYATAPMMSVDDLQRGKKTLEIDHRTDYVISVGTSTLRDAAQFYWGKADAFLNGRPLLQPFTMMCPVDEKRICDINTEEDWLRAERMYGEV